LLGEDWQVEFKRLYSASQALALARQAPSHNENFHFPSGFDSECELLRSVEREHVELSRVKASVTVRQVKPRAAVLFVKSSCGDPVYFWRREIDPHVPRILEP